MSLGVFLSLRLTTYSTLRHKFSNFLVESIRLFIEHPMTTVKDGPLCQSWPLASLIHPRNRLLQTLQWEAARSASSHDEGRLADKLDSLPMIVPRVVGQQPRQPPPIAQRANAREERLVLSGSLGADLVALLGGEAVAKAFTHKPLVSRIRRPHPSALRVQHARLVVAPEVSLRGVPVVEARTVLERGLVGENEAGEVAVAEELDVRPQDRGADGAADGHDLGVCVALAEGLDDRPEVSGQSGDVVAPLGPPRGAVAPHVGR